MSPCILVVDDRSDIRISARFVLEDNNYQVLEADSPFQAKELIKAHHVDVVLLDMNYSLDTTSGEEGLTFLAWLQKQELNISAIAMTNKPFCAPVSTLSTFVQLLVGFKEFGHYNGVVFFFEDSIPKGRRVKFQ